MNDVIVNKVAALSLYEIIILLCAIVFLVIVLILGVCFAFDKLNIKSISFRNGFTFYQDGEERRRPRKRKARKV